MAIIGVDYGRADLTALYTMYKKSLDYEITKAFYTPPMLCISREEEKKLRLGSAYAIGNKKFLKAFEEKFVYIPTKEKAMEFTIVKMQDSGYVVYPRGRSHFEQNTPTFASTTIEEALKFIKGQLEPKEKKNADH